MADNRSGQEVKEAGDCAAKQALTLALTDQEFETVKRMSSSGEKAQRDRPNAMRSESLYRTHAPKSTTDARDICVIKLLTIHQNFPLQTRRRQPQMLFVIDQCTLHCP